MSQVSTFTVKLAGTVMLGFGIGFAILGGWMVGRQLSPHQPIEIGGLVFVAVLAILAAFCSLVGYRLLFNRPNQHGTLLSPIGWKIVAGFFWIGASAFAFFSIWLREFGLLVAAGFAGALGHWCLLASRGPTIQDLSSILIPPETSLVGVEGFLPPGFACGVELFNDDHTPMQFVVTMLQDNMGMTEKDAIRAMLDIHQKGGVLLPTSTPEEATRIAEAITSKARENNHPLVCRAVDARGSSE